MPPDPYGGFAGGWTWTALAAVFDTAYLPILWRTTWLSLAATVICVALAFPTAYCIGTSSVRAQRWLLLLVVTPFWTSFLVRVFAWKVLLRPEGLVAEILAASGMAAPETQLLYSSGAVLLVTVYTFLPYAVLPLYAAVARFDFSLLEAARDLGASPLRAVLSVFLPGMKRGLATAAILVFVPCLGSYVIPDLVGGPHSELLGNKIAQRIFVDRNLPEAAAAGSLLTALVMLPALAVMVMERRRLSINRGHPGKAR